MTDSSDTVMVTGGSGFLATWIIVALLQRGYKVRSTVRSAAREAQARANITRAVDPGDRLSFTFADLLDEAGWSEAAAGARYVIHPASPMQVGEYAKTDVIRPAREGTLRVLEAAKKAGAEHVVVTSSVEACKLPATSAGVANEDVWTNLEGKGVSDYGKSKTLAEQDLWDWAGKAERPTVTTILPGFIQGPVLGEDFSGSVELVAKLMRGQAPMAPRIGMSMVDVRDVAALHIRAMTDKAARGKRFVAAGDFLWFLEVSELLRERFRGHAGKLPTKEAPDAMIKAAALMNAEMRQLVPSLGKRREFDSSRAKRLLDWQARPAREAVLDGAQSLIDLGLV